MERALAQIPDQQGGRAMVFSEADRQKLIREKNRSQGLTALKREINLERAKQKSEGKPIHLSDELFRRLQSWKASLPYTIERSKLERTKKKAKDTSKAYKKSKGKREKDFYANLESLSPSELIKMSKSQVEKAGKRRR